MSRQKLVGFPAIFGNELWVRVVGHELPWSRDARMANHAPRRSPHFMRVVQTTGSVIHGYKHLVKCPCPSTTIPDSYVTL